MAQKLDVKSFVLASALISGIVYIACALLSWISPEFILRAGNYLAHSVDLTKIARIDITLSSTIIGFVLTLILTCLVGSLFAWAYNKLTK